MDVVGYSKIVGIGGYVPKQIVSSDDLMKEANSQRFGIPESYISDNIGIKQRRVSATNELPSDLAIEASLIALNNSGLQPADIDLLIFCGIDRDWQEPSTAHRIQCELTLSNASCLDMSNACHGFMDGLSLANAYMSMGAVNRALICTGEQPSHVLFDYLKLLRETKCKKYFKEHFGALTVGDGGGAVILEKCGQGEGILRMQSLSEGEHANLCYYKYGKQGLQGIMLMREISIQIARMHKKLIASTYAKLGWNSSVVDRVYCHQVGAKPHKLLAEIVGKELADAPMTYPLYGNLTSATIPLNLFLNRPEKGSRLLILGTGSGLTISQAGLIY